MLASDNFQAVPKTLPPLKDFLKSKDHAAAAVSGADPTLVDERKLVSVEANPSSMANLVDGHLDNLERGGHHIPKEAGRVKPHNPHDHVGALTAVSTYCLP